MVSQFEIYIAQRIQRTMGIRLCAGTGCPACSVRNFLNCCAAGFLLLLTAAFPNVSHSLYTIGFYLWRYDIFTLWNPVTKRCKPSIILQKKIPSPLLINAGPGRSFFASSRTGVLYSSTCSNWSWKEWLEQNRKKPWLFISPFRGLKK